MAKPIKETPILRGKEAEHFLAGSEERAGRFPKLRRVEASSLRAINQKFLPDPLQAM